ncbi:MAG: hypothetical protein WCG83_06660 [Candidatus Peregrinibacteria bacterium]
MSNHEFNSNNIDALFSEVTEKEGVKTDRQRYKEWCDQTTADPTNQLVSMLEREGFTYSVPVMKPVFEDVWNRMLQARCIDQWQSARNDLPKLTQEAWDRHIQSENELRHPMMTAVDRWLKCWLGKLQALIAKTHTHPEK